MTRKHERIAALVGLACRCAAVVLFAACGGSPAAPAPTGEAGEVAIENAIRGSCHVAAPTSCPMPSPHYSDIAPIVERDCVPCHSGATADGPWPLTGYEPVAEWAGAIRDDLDKCTMPPLDGGVPINATDRLAILAWIQCGNPQ